LIKINACPACRLAFSNPKGIIHANAHEKNIGARNYGVKLLSSWTLNQPIYLSSQKEKKGGQRKEVKLIFS